MNARKYALSVALALVFALLALMPGFRTPIADAQDPVKAAVVCTAPLTSNWKTDGNCNTTPGMHFVGTLDDKALVFKTNSAERMRISANGNLGVGTSNPGIQIDIQGSRSIFNGVGIQLFNTNGGNTNKWVLGTGGAAVAKDAFSIGDVSVTKMTILANGNVGIGTTNPLAMLQIKSNTSGTKIPFHVEGSAGQTLFNIFADGSFGFALLSTVYTSSTHTCHAHPPLGGYFLTRCSSAAAYVPTIDGGGGYPQTAELVSLAPLTKNPYLDAHAPFAVQKSTTPCDTNLFGIIGNAAEGADGEKKNEHYLPLALSGNLPVKVTMENGFIKRGDALTSSSKAGYAMKATEACKTIGYALEDATTEGTIQVFAGLGENAAPQVAQLQDRIKDLAAQNEALKAQNAAFEARLAAIERALQLGTQPADNRNTAVVASR